MVTVKDLYRIAQQVDEEADAIAPMIPQSFGTPEHQRLCRAYQTAQSTLCCALAAAAWLERAGLREARFVGPFGGPLPQKDQRVRIRRGALVRDARGKARTSGRSQTILVHRVRKGWIDLDRTVHNPEVVWAGAGGYWRWTDANDVEIMESAEAHNRRSETDHHRRRI